MLKPKLSGETELSNFPKVEMKNLPSNFLPYPEGSKIHYRPYSFGEINEISGSKISDEEQIKFVMKGIETTFDPYELTFGDYLHIALYRKLSTLGGSKFTVQYRCDKCGNMGKFEFLIEKLDFDELQIPKLPVILTLSNGKELHFTPITVNDYLTLLKKNLYRNKTAGLAVQVRNIGFDEAYDTIYKCIDLDDMRNLDEIDKILYHSLRPINVICQNSITHEDKSFSICGNKINVSIDGGGVVILPFRPDTIPERGGIRFGT